jgi:hypothetical protein
VAGFISEWRPTSIRNGGRIQIGIPGRIASEFAGEPSSQGKFNAFLAFLKEYKELITTVVFFAGGVSWVFGYFATKEELKTLDCLLTNHVQFLKGMQERKTLDDEYVETHLQRERLNKPAERGRPSDAQLREMDGLNQRMNRLESERDDAEKRALEAKNKLESRACEKREKQ